MYYMYICYLFQKQILLYTQTEHSFLFSFIGDDWMEPSWTYTECYKTEDKLQTLFNVTYEFAQQCLNQYIANKMSSLKWNGVL